MTVRQLIMALLDHDYDKQVHIWDKTRAQGTPIDNVTPKTTDSNTIIIQVKF